MRHGAVAETQQDARLVVERAGTWQRGLRTNRRVTAVTGVLAFVGSWSAVAGGLLVVTFVAAANVAISLVGCGFHTVLLRRVGEVERKHAEKLRSEAE